jgi:succinate dehydrogenase/fumarate reductase flavoprotein subunit
MLKQVIVIGGGLSGLSAAHTALEHGAKVILLDKNPFCGGNSTKATSGLNAALTKTQIRKGIEDSAEIFEKDTARSANLGKSEETYPLAKVKYFINLRCYLKILIRVLNG